jgi:hypothetical protein
VCFLDNEDTTDGRSQTENTLLYRYCTTMISINVSGRWACFPDVFSRISVYLFDGLFRLSILVALHFEQLQ